MIQSISERICRIKEIEDKWNFLDVDTEIDLKLFEKAQDDILWLLSENRKLASLCTKLRNKIESDSG